ncbi:MULTISPECIES: hypothetical protein [Rhodomicrobium]|uniref:hypothetical protein n=1 Tax=Rhodomicrobium TaxID=1068 RepID=UPI000B4A823C|nr:MULTISPECIES: hypothetical protein [Rhodomicrobium]
MRYLTTAFLAILLSLSLAGGASATQPSAPTLTLKDFTAASPATKVDYRDYCVRQYFKCRHFSDGGYEFRKCMQWKGCWEAYVEYKERHSENSCRDWRHTCAENWGRGTDDFYGCLRYHGCD